jgi:hypothetical protein
MKIRGKFTAHYKQGKIHEIELTPEELAEQLTNLEIAQVYSIKNHQPKPTQDCKESIYPCCLASLQRQEECPIHGKPLKKVGIEEIETIDPDYKNNRKIWLAIVFLKNKINELIRALNQRTNYA